MFKSEMRAILMVQLPRGTGTQAVPELCGVARDSDVPHGPARNLDAGGICTEPCVQDVFKINNTRWLNPKDCQTGA